MARKKAVIPDAAEQETIEKKPLMTGDLPARFSIEHHTYYGSIFQYVLGVYEDTLRVGHVMADPDGKNPVLSIDVTILLPRQTTLELYAMMKDVVESIVAYERK